MYIFCSLFLFFYLQLHLVYSQRLYNIENREQNVEKVLRVIDYEDISRNFRHAE